MRRVFTGLKNSIKAQPRLYDLLNVRRPLENETQRWLDRFSQSRGGAVRFVQIGASDGLRWDPLRRFIVRDGWAGVLVEPLPPVYDLLLANYRYLSDRDLRFANVVVSSESREAVDFWGCSRSFCDSLDVEEMLYYMRLSSLDRSMVERALAHFDTIEDKIESYRVPCVSVNSLIDEYCDSADIDLIFIDAEGHDDQIVRGIDLDRTRPAAIVYESHNLGDRKAGIESYLRDRGYRIRELSGDSAAELVQ